LKKLLSAAAPQTAKPKKRFNEQPLLAPKLAKCLQNYGVLILHGLTGAPSEMRPVEKALQKARLRHGNADRWQDTATPTKRC